MTATSFFRHCNELVKVRWLASLTYGGQIILLPTFVLGTECFEIGLPPLEAVASDIRGKLMKKTDTLEAAKALEMPLGIAMLVEAASLTRDGLDPDANEIRQQLLLSIRQKNVLKTEWELCKQRAA